MSGKDSEEGVEAGEGLEGGCDLEEGLEAGCGRGVPGGRPVVSGEVPLKRGQIGKKGLACLRTRCLSDQAERANCMKSRAVQFCQVGFTRGWRASFPLRVGMKVPFCARVTRSVEDRMRKWL